MATKAPPPLAFAELHVVEVAVEKPRPARHHGERRVDRHFSARDGADVSGMAHHPVRISRLEVRLDFPIHSVVGFVLRADHDLSAGPQPGHPVSRSLARRAGRDVLDMDWRMAVSALRGPLHELQRPLRRLGRHRGVSDVDLSLKLRLRVGHLFLRGAGGGPGEIR